MQRDANRGHWLTTAFLVVIAAVFYTLLRRFTAHGSDAFFLMEWMQEGVVHANHPLYLIVARGVRVLLAPVTTDRMTVLAVFSALGAAVAVGGMHRAALRLRSPAFAFWLAAIVLCTPCLMFFATIAEMHAPFAGAMALCWWGWTRWCERGRIAVALGVGVLTAIATTLHATGQLLVPMLAAGYLWMRRSDSWARRGGAVSIFVVAHATLFALLFAWLRTLGPVPTGEPAGFLWERAASGLWLAYLPQAIWTQWGIAFAPLSLLALLAFARGRVLVGIGVHCAVLGYVAVTAMLAPGADEVGAYCLPLLFPVAVVVLDCAPCRYWWMLVVATAAATALHRSVHPQLVPDFALGDTIAASANEPPRTWLVGDEGESWGARWRNDNPELIEAWITLVDVELRQAANGTMVSAGQLQAWLEATLQGVTASGRQLVVTEHAVAALSARLPAFAAGWPQFAAAHRLEPIAAPGWRGFLVRP